MGGVGSEVAVCLNILCGREEERMLSVVVCEVSSWFEF